MLNNGLLIQIQVCPFTGDTQEIHFDKYLVGKLSEQVSDGIELFYSLNYQKLFIYNIYKRYHALFAVIITKSHLICTYNDNLVTLVYFTKAKMHIFDKINKLEPKLITTDLFVPNGRRLDKKIQVNKSTDLVIAYLKYIFQKSWIKNFLDD
jgi:hypothetical protein